MLGAGLTACAVPNRVSVVSEGGLLPSLVEGRYSNLYRGKQQYPHTCSEDCYPVREELQCETPSPASACRYVGTRPGLKDKTGFSLQWHGHASFSITTPDGKQLLIDPVSEQFDWPVNWAYSLFGGSSRVAPPTLGVAEFARADAVLYSHLHYDHFNKRDLEKVGANAEFLVPPGMAEYFPDQGYLIKEVYWFSSVKIGDTEIQGMPAHHFNSRYWVPFIYDDHEKALWSGWLLKHGGKTLFFAGDTGYSRHFADIRARVGAIDICLLPIASYHHATEGAWYRHVHTTPEDALAAAKDLGCKLLIPWGYGKHSWGMGDISSHAPLQRLLKEYPAQGQDIPLLILNEGERVAL
ncbi:MBL fold metallo-hydrolase [Paucibacter sp. M5-1]|uniref:MBL fold metallo-hydrolase n=1 Tax=Paucibacter sp. M5-1 TaxID=3015998 RepID=UPI003F7D4F04